MTDLYIEHDTDSRDCWCNPALYALCPECGGSEEGCWRCESGHNGLVVTAGPEGDETLIIVHNDIRVPA